jgi:thioredoxin-dependent peroxiredoxin
MRKALWMFLAVGVMAIGVIGFRDGAAAQAGTTLQPGAVAPSFSLPTQIDNVNASLKDYKGKFVVLYFYPKDMTTGCTIEAHNFERDTAKYAAANAVVLGVSLDTVESHKTFCSKDGLNFKLLADPDHKVIDAYGVPVMARGDNKFASRDTFLIGPDGKIVKVWEVKDIQAHSDDVLAAIADAKK